jgi:hypothetical protein
MTLRSATTSSSSMLMQERNPRVRSRGYISESPLIVTTLLLDRSWAIQDCVGNNFLLFAPNPNNFQLLLLKYLGTKEFNRKVSFYSKRELFRATTKYVFGALP